MDRYGKDVLARGWQQAGRPVVTDQPLEIGLVVEVSGTDFCGAVMTWENGLVVLEDRAGRRRSFPVGAGFLLEGRPVRLRVPPRQGASHPRYTASGSRVGQPRAARMALPSRIWVEGTHDAELIEKVWGADLRHVGAVVEPIGGVDNLAARVTSFAPARGRRLGVLVDHLVDRSKESRIAAEVGRTGFGDFVRITGHRHIDIWQAVQARVVGRPSWPEVPRGTDIKVGTLAALGWPHADQADIARGWQRILAGVHSFRDLDHDFVREVEGLIDFITQDHLVG